METREAVHHFLETVREHSGLFVERGEGLYGFMHLTFEEYFTARQLVSQQFDQGPHTNSGTAAPPPMARADPACRRIVEQTILRRYSRFAASHPKCR